MCSQREACEVCCGGDDEALYHNGSIVQLQSYPFAEEGDFDTIDLFKTHSRSDCQELDMTEENLVWELSSNTGAKIVSLDPDTRERTPRPPIVEVKPPFDDPQVDGTWFASNCSRPLFHYIQGSVLRWADGSMSFLKISSDGVDLSHEGEWRQGVLVKNGSELEWSTGEKWLRADMQGAWQGPNDLVYYLLGSVLTTFNHRGVILNTQEVTITSKRTILAGPKDLKQKGKMLPSGQQLLWDDGILWTRIGRPRRRHLAKTKQMEGAGTIPSPDDSGKAPPLSLGDGALGDSVKDDRERPKWKLTLTDPDEVAPHPLVGRQCSLDAEGLLLSAGFLSENEDIDALLKDVANTLAFGEDIAKDVANARGTLTFGL